MLTALPDAAAAAAWLRARVRGTLATDSRAVQAGDGFLAWPGRLTDGRRFVEAALAAGAAACLVEAEGVERFAFAGAAEARIASLRALKAACGAIADEWFGHPGRALAIVATTGTNGKTSTSWWTAQALAALPEPWHRRAGVIGTLGVGEPPALVHTGLTTPDAVALHAALRDFVDAGIGACAIEASSIGIVEHRLDALAIDVALFTNFTQDHLDYHGSMPEYWAAKRWLFEWPGLEAAVINIDDEAGAGLADELRRRGPDRQLELWTVSLAGPAHAAVPTARLTAGPLGYVEGGLAFEVREAGGGSAMLRSRLVGAFNASNLLVVLGGLRALGVPLAEAVAALAAVTPVPGRMQRLAGREVEVVVDYAHTPDALEHVLAALRPLAAARGGRLWCVFGCGGDRDPTKRPLMGAIAARAADRVVITSDNPRHEAPTAILAQILAGATGIGGHDEVAVIEDRREAIHGAIAEARAGDVVLIAGKGHEDYQEVAGVKRPFSDIEQARVALAAREGGAGTMPERGGTC